MNNNRLKANACRSITVIPSRSDSSLLGSSTWINFNLPNNKPTATRSSRAEAPKLNGLSSMSSMQSRPPVLI